MEETLQHSQITQCTGLPTTDTRNHHLDGSKANHPLTFKLDQSMGVGQWELVFVKSKINEAKFLTHNEHYNGEEKAKDTLEFSTQSGVHPVWLQENYEELLGVLGASKAQFKKAKTKTR